jgi:Xaa-Pro aminopeptidase
MDMYDLPLEERDRRWKETRETMKKRGLDCLVIWGSFGFNRFLIANMRYLSNVCATEGYFVFPREGEPTLITFFGRHDTAWVDDCRAGHPMHSKAIAQRIGELHLEKGNIGIVGTSGFFAEMGFAYATYTSLVKLLPEAHFVDVTDMIESVRRIKSGAEIKCFELGCEAGVKAIKAVVDVVKVGMRDRDVQATLLDTLYRNGCEAGSMLLYCSGKVVSHAGQGQDLPLPGPRQIEKGDMILTEMDARYGGYIAQFNQPYSVGEPDKEWRKKEAVALESFNTGLKVLRPGIMIGELDEAMLSVITKAGYTWRNPMFHGLGLSIEGPMGRFPVQKPFEPFLTIKTQPGQVIEIEPHVVSPDGKTGLTIGCPVLVTETGCRPLNDAWKPEIKIIKT